MTDTFDADATLIRVLTDPACIPDPYPLYRELREKAPIFQTAITGTWVVNRYDDAKAAADNGRFTTFFHAMLERGVALAPGPYEALFPSLAHSSDDIAETLEAVAGAAEVLAAS